MKNKTNFKAILVKARTLRKLNFIYTQLKVLELKPAIKVLDSHKYQIFILFPK